MNGKPENLPALRGQRGAALVVGLILLLVLTVLAVSGVFTATMELRMVRNTQSQERAFQAAEVAIENALANPVISTSVPEIQGNTPNPNAVDDSYAYTLAYTCTSTLGTGSTGFSLGVSGFSAFHFQIDATGTGPDNAVSQHVQGFYVIGPPDTENC
jgi:type IV pilus assembly protein PilX